MTAHSELLNDEGRQRLVRHGFLPEREVMTGIGKVAVQASRRRPLLTQIARRFGSHRRLCRRICARRRLSLGEGLSDWRLLAARHRRIVCGRTIQYSGGNHGRCHRYHSAACAGLHHVCVGPGLTFDDFSRVARKPRDFFIGAIAQIVLLPCVAFALISVWSLPPELALGVMIIAAAPGGVTSNILTAFGHGDVALSISLTAVISLLSVVTIPAVVVFSYAQLIGGQAGDVSVANTAVSVFVIVTVPVLIGLAVRRFAENFVARFEPVARQISAILFVLVLVGAIFQERANIVTYFAQAGLVTLVLNLVMMVLAYVIARMFASGQKQRITISLECGLQNGTLAIAVAALLFDGGLATVPATTYSLIMLATALIFIFFLRRGQADG